MKFETRLLPALCDDIAPDGSEIRLLAATSRGNLCHCTLPAAGISKAVRHRSVEEIWYFIEGQGEVWRHRDQTEEVVSVFPGLSLSIPLGTDFQFRNTGSTPLRFVIITLPPWPSPDEAVFVVGKW